MPWTFYSSTGQKLSTAVSGIITGGTDNAALRANGTGGSTSQASQVIIADCGLVQAEGGNAAGPAYSFSADTDTGMYRKDANDIGFSLGGTEHFVMADRNFFSGDDANGNMEKGISINQAAFDGQSLALKSSDVAHGRTTLVETDTYGLFKKSSGASGGLRIEGFQENNTRGIDIYSHIGADNTAKSTGASAAGAYTARRHNCSDADAAFTANSNIFMMEVVDNGSSAVRFIFDVEGSAHADVEWTTYSDGRLKTNRSDIPYGLDTLKQLEPKIYCRDSGYLDDGTIVLEGTPHRHIGFIAQDVKKLIPEIVKDVCENESWYSLEDGKLTAVVVKAVQELEERVSALEGK